MTLLGLPPHRCLFCPLGETPCETRSLYGEHRLRGGHAGGRRGRGGGRGGEEGERERVELDMVVGEASEDYPGTATGHAGGDFLGALVEGLCSEWRYSGRLLTNDEDAERDRCFVSLDAELPM